MNPQDLERLEREAAEIIGAMKALLNEFESRLGEVVSAQRVAESELRAESTHITRHLRELATHARELAADQRTLLTRIERDWQLEIDENAQRAGAAQAQAFGERIAAGLEARLAELVGEVERATRRLTGKIALRWTLGLAIAVPLMVMLSLSAFMPRPPDPSIPGLTAEQAHAVLSRITPCWPRWNDIRDMHVCVVTDDPPRLARGPHEEAVVIVRGM